LRAETRLVRVNVIVENREGQLLEDLKKEDFTFFDNGPAQSIALFSSETGVPLAIHAATRNLRLVVGDAASGLVGSITIPLEKFLSPPTDLK
jgi:hypothetical protein